MTERNTKHGKPEEVEASALDALVMRLRDAAANFPVIDEHPAELFRAAADAIDSRTDSGPWSVYSEGGDVLGVLSDDFSLDVLLRVSGAFPDETAKESYCRELASRLNGAYTP